MAKGNLEEPLSEPVKKASAITSELLVSFGAGYAVQAEREKPLTGILPAPENLPAKPPAINPPPIFGDVAVLQKFQLLLLAGCIENKDDLLWTPDDNIRDFTLKMAFLHGMFSRMLITRNGETVITPAVLKESLDIVQNWCGRKSGGGPACPAKL